MKINRIDRVNITNDNNTERDERERRERIQELDYRFNESTRYHHETGTSPEEVKRQRELGKQANFQEILKQSIDEANKK